jgi:hypothetical protein
LLPLSPSGGVLAAAFDRGMTPEGQVQSTVPLADAVMIAALFKWWPEILLWPIAARPSPPR